MTEQQEWRIGELARATRVTVRALHHYDRLGLLAPSSRTAGGHRCYTGDDVRRLHTILALRGFGLPLRDIAAALAAGGEDPREILRRQLAETEERIRQAQQVRISLLGLLSRLDRPEPSQFVTLIEEMVTMSQPLTPEFLASQDCVLISTDHSAYDHDFIVEHSKMVLDTRNATKNVKQGREKIFKA